MKKMKQIHSLMVWGMLTLCSFSAHGQSVETRPRVAPDQEPAFGRQLRVPAVQTKTNYKVRIPGGGADEEAWSSLGRACQIMDNLIALDKAEPMIVVMPNASPNQLASPDVLPPLPGPVMIQQDMDSEEFHSGGPYVKSLIEDIIPFVESHYNVIKKKEGRAIAGFSMGGSLYLVYDSPLSQYVRLYRGIQHGVHSGERSGS